MNDLIQKYRGQIPQIKGYKVTRLFFSKNQGIKYGAILKGTSEIIFLAEPNAKFSSGYKSNFKLCDWSNSHSVCKKNVVYTIEGKHSKKLLKQILFSKKLNFRDLIFGLNYLPESVNNWNLVTVFFWYEKSDHNENCVIKNLQANYLKQGKYINLKIKTGCDRSELLPSIKKKESSLNGFKMIRLDSPEKSYVCFKHNNLAYLAFRKKPDSIKPLNDLILEVHRKVFK